ncbi:MAG: cytochrome c oxidase subunit 3 [Pyrinomonadaceae bacterium]|nr:cytochrome c oxidase subunit 3 [Pyrinomonadaceae bacterium]
MREEQMVLDVKGLPEHGFDTREPMWWGNLLLLLIETMTFVIAGAAFFYVSQNFNIWPPPRTETYSQLNPLPGLGNPTANLIALIVSASVMIWVDRSARRADKRAIKIGLLICLLLNLGSITLRAFEFMSIHVRWNSNAYGSVLWAILILHLMHLIVETAEAFILSVYTFNRPLDPRHRLDITVLAVYWYWVTIIWIPLYLMIYLGPRFH